MQLCCSWKLYILLFGAVWTSFQDKSLLDKLESMSEEHDHEMLQILAQLSTVTVI